VVRTDGPVVVGLTPAHSLQLLLLDNLAMITTQGHDKKKEIPALEGCPSYFAGTLSLYSSSQLPVLIEKICSVKGLLSADKNRYALFFLFFKK